MSGAARFHTLAMRPKRKRKPRELGLHKFTAQYLRLTAYPDVLWLHIPNGEPRSAATGAKLKAMGVLAGAADFLVMSIGQVLFLEVKGTKGRLSDTQKAFRQRALDAGAIYAVADSPDAVRKILSPFCRVAIAPAEAA